MGLACPHPQPLGLSASVLGPTGRPSWERFWGPLVERALPATPPCGALTLLEDLQGDGGVLDGHDDTAMVQVEDVVLLLEDLAGRGAP